MRVRLPPTNKHEGQDCGIGTRREPCKRKTNQILAAQTSSWDFQCRAACTDDSQMEVLMHACAHPYVNVRACGMGEYGKLSFASSHVQCRRTEHENHVQKRRTYHAYTDSSPQH